MAATSADPQGDLIDRVLASEVPGEQKQVPSVTPNPPTGDDGNSLPKKSDNLLDSILGGEEVAPTQRAAAPSAKSGDDIPDSLLPKVEDLPSTPPVAAEEDETPPPEVQKGGKKGVDAWTKSKREAKELRKAKEALEAELLEYKSGKLSADKSAELSTKVTEYEAKLQESEKNRTALEDRVGRLDISQSPAFKKQFDEPINQKFSKTVGLLAQSGIDAKSARDLISKAIAVGNTPEQIQEMVQDFPLAVQGAVYAGALEMIEDQKRRAAAIQDWRATKALVSEEERRHQEAQTAERLVSNIDSAVDILKVEGSWLFKTIPENNEWNAKVAERVEAVRGVLKVGTPDVLAKYVAEGVAAPMYRKLYETQRATSAKLMSELKRSGRVSPGLGGGHDGAPDPEPKPKAINADNWLEKTLLQ